MTRMVSAVAAFTRSHPRIVPLALLAAGFGVATSGAISLLTPQVLPRCCSGELEERRNARHD